MSQSEITQRTEAIILEALDLAVGALNTQRKADLHEDALRCVLLAMRGLEHDWEDRKSDFLRGNSSEACHVTWMLAHAFARGTRIYNSPGLKGLLESFIEKTKDDD